MVIDMSSYRKTKEEYVEAEEAFKTILDLDSNTVLIISKVDGKLKIAEVRASRFHINI